jgi:Domain of unknown function (DUF4294)
MKNILFIGLIFVTAGCFGQGHGDMNPDSLRMYESDPVPIFTKDYMRKYNRLKRLILKVYPYALYASDVLYQLESDAEEIAKRRKKKKFYKSAYKNLKGDFKYVFLELYTSEGQMLMKLVHRETGMTVHQIAEKYKGKRSATVFNIMGKIWNQNVKVRWQAEGDDAIGEHVIKDIVAGKITFNEKVVRVDKEQYKINKKAHRKRLRDSKRKRRKNKKDCEKNQ